MKLNDKCFALYVNVTSNYISFKIEQGKYLGTIAISAPTKNNYSVEHFDDEVNYLSKEDIFKTEAEAIKALIKMLGKKVKNAKC